MVWSYVDPFPTILNIAFRYSGFPKGLAPKSRVLVVMVSTGNRKLTPLPLLLKSCLSHGDLIGLAQAASLFAFRQSESVRHRTVDDNGVGLVQQSVDNGNLVADLGTPENYGKRSFGSSVFSPRNSSSCSIK